jgi:hypothetical protein
MLTPSFSAAWIAEIADETIDAYGSRLTPGRDATFLRTPSAVSTAVRTS